jgi:rhodanese-related sulfurtransferase
VGGIQEWRKFNYPMIINKEWQKIKIKKIRPKEFARLLKEKDYYVLDVRPLDFKLNSSFIKGSFLCPLVFLADRYKEIPKGRQILVTDWAMKQSPVAAKYLSIKGYPIFGVLKGGIERWESEKFPVEQREATEKLLPLSFPENK